MRIHKSVDKRKAYRIDKVTKEDYEQNLEENLAKLVKQMQSGNYRPNATRRVHIPKETKGRMDGKKQFFRCRVKTSRKKFRSKIEAMKVWIKIYRAISLEQIFKIVNAKLRGHYQYYGVTENTKEVKSFLMQTKWLLFKWLNRRSQRRSYTMDTFFNGFV